ncbi:MAG TPA: HlyD family efflux transporter periplasmic adaptor subunit [Chloroflexota bacterium]
MSSPAPTITPAEAPSNGKSAEEVLLAPTGQPIPRRGGRLRRILPPLGLVVLAIIGVIAFNIWWQSGHYVSTDNAEVGGQLVPVGSMNAGRVVSIRAAVGAPVHEGDVLARVELPTAVKTSQNGTPDLEFLGAADQVADVKSPVNGFVAAVPSAVGATVAQGTPIVTLLDPNQVWITANVNENDVARLQIGQAADVHLDALNKTVPGVVRELTPATAGAFSLLPQSNTTTNFTKVSQVVPVRIGVESLAGNPGLLGSSAEVKIRVA